MSEAERIPSALYGSRSQPFELHLEGNPILPRGRQQLERAVDRAAELGVYVQVFGGGSMDPPSHNSLKLGPLELTLGGKKIDRRELEMLWRYPPTLKHDLSQITQSLFFFLLGVLFGVITGTRWMRRNIVTVLELFMKFQIRAMKLLITSVGTGGDVPQNGGGEPGAAPSPVQATSQPGAGPGGAGGGADGAS